MDIISFSEYLLKELRAQIELRSEHLTHGGAKDWDAYCRVTGEVTGLSSAEHLLLDLLKKMEKVNDD